MVKKNTPPVDDEKIADEAVRGSRSILERVTGEKLTHRPFVVRASSGGAARASKLTPKMRSEIAAKAARARWKK